MGGAAAAWGCIRNEPAWWHRRCCLLRTRCGALALSAGLHAPLTHPPSVPTHRHSIAEAAADGLKPDKFVAVAAAGAANGAAGGAARAGTTAAAAAGVEFPSFEGLMKYLVGRHPQLGRAVEEGAALPLPAKVRPGKAAHGSMCSYGPLCVGGDGGVVCLCG